ncbi:hypothetical protein VNI00_015359 [Paramarasmius palmivorus]|uniref:Dienelactone hydrolase domain-containing protein n=1 Tax=Paramarasmius palmivorus TaxID=297713 RepID=A0AAW0BNE4_9AGAR
MSLCKDCVKGVIHEGTAKGKWEKIGGVDCYVATPSNADYPKDKVLLYLADAFGPQFINAKAFKRVLFANSCLPSYMRQLLVDSFAENGFKTIAPDYFDGDAVPEGLLIKHGANEPLNPDIVLWLSRHTQEQTRPILDKVINALKEQGTKEFGATGYCFGGRYVFDLAIDNVIKAGAASHPSLLQIPADLEKYVKTSQTPLLINSCEVDDQFPLEAQTAADKVFKDFAPGYKRVHFDGCVHGFAVRGDLNNPKVKEGKEGAFKNTIEWMVKHL